MRRWAGAMLALVACAKTDRLYCPLHPEDTVHCPGVDGGTTCASDADCPGEVCDLTAMPPQCVQCTKSEPGACTGMTPICVDDRCAACRTDDDCPDGVCMPDGSCPAASQIIYATVTGATAGACGSLAAPCAITRAVMLVSPTLAIIKMVPSATDFTVAGGGGLTLPAMPVTIDARGATLRKTSNGQVVTVPAGASVTILGGLITGGMGGGDGIFCMNATLTLLGTVLGVNTGSGLNDNGCATTVTSATLHDNTILGVNKSAGSITMSRSTLKTNIGGGLLITGTLTRFAIVGNVFWMNGTQGGTVGGASVATNTGGESRFDFNSFNANLATSPHGNAFECIVNGFNPKNNVMFGNVNTNIGNLEQVSGLGCVHTYSIASPGTPLTGMGNSTADPQFFDALTGNLHTQPASPTEHAADPMTDLTGPAALDIDGDARKAPADIGADQH